MPRETGEVTRVGIDNIQFYVPKDIRMSDECVFDPDDDFEVTTIDGVGLLFTPPEIDATVGEVLDALGVDATAVPDHITNEEANP